jgi:hypothetical protein
MPTTPICESACAAGVPASGECATLQKPVGGPWSAAEPRDHPFGAVPISRSRQRPSWRAAEAHFRDRGRCVPGCQRLARSPRLQLPQRPPAPGHGPAAHPCLCPLTPLWTLRTPCALVIATSARRQWRGRRRIGGDAARRKGLCAATIKVRRFSSRLSRYRPSSHSTIVKRT